MTPNELDVLIHYYTSPSRHPRYDAPAVKEVINMWEGEGILKRSGQGTEIVTTLKGRVFIATILATKQPKLAWVNANKEFIEYEI